MADNTESKDQRAKELRAVFDALDTNKNGKLSVEEIKQAISKLGIQANQAELDEFLKLVDKDGDGNVTFFEFAKASRSKFYSKKDKKNLLDEFKKYDTNHTGFITSDEVFAVLSKSRGNFTLEEAKALVKKADKDGDGKINILEFLGLFD